MFHKKDSDKFAGVFMLNFYYNYFSLLTTPPFLLSTLIV